MTRFRGTSQAVLWKFFPQFNLAQIVTSLWELGEWRHIQKNVDDRVYPYPLWRHTSDVTWLKFWRPKWITPKTPGYDSGGFVEIFSTEVFYSDLGILGAFWRLDFWRMCGKNFHNLSIGVPRFCGKNFHNLPIGVKPPAPTGLRLRIITGSFLD